MPPPKRDGRLALILGIIGVLLLCCCAGAAVGLLAWGGDIYDGIRDRSRHSIELNEPSSNGGTNSRLELAHP